MNITFKGMQNVGCYYTQYNNDPENKKERISIQLNNNGNKDLDEFKDVLKAYPGLQEPDFLDMEFRSYPNRLDPDKQITNVFINSKPLELNNKNIPIFVKINNLLKRISKGEDIPNTPDYIKSENCYERYISRIYGKSYETQALLLQVIHNYTNVRIGSEEISEKLTKLIKNFCESDTDPFTEIKSVCGFSFKNEAKSINRLRLDLKPEDSEIFEDFLSKHLPISNDENLSQITVDVYESPGMKKPKISINNIPIEIEYQNFKMLGKVSELLNKIIKTKEEIQFPKDYLSNDSFNEMSNKLLPRNYLEALFNFPQDKRDERGIDITVITSNDEAKAIAKEIDKTIKKEINDYLN